MASTPPSKLHFEKVVLAYTVVWTCSLGIIVHWKCYEYFNPNDYLALSMVLAIPCFLLPVLFVCPSDRYTPYHKRFSTKANVFIGIISYLGNHFFTHYFYNVLGMRYTGPLAEGEGFDVNGVMYFMTHVYFLSYHVVITKILRLLVSFMPDSSYSAKIVVLIAIFVLSIITAFIETFTISNFPYYTYPDYNMMITKGSVFHSIFLSVSFLLFYYIDEMVHKPWNITEVAFSALGGMMIVLLLADYWRLAFESSDISVPYA